MSSILTNNSAMVALQTLKSVNSNLADTQSAISTGKSVASAKDNSAVWAISKVMESDVKGFKAISESLSLGQSTVAVARNGAEKITDLLNDIKGKVISANEENFDGDKLQADLASLRDQITSITGAAQFNGLNLLGNKDGGTDLATSLAKVGSSEVNVLSSLDRSADGSVASSTITAQKADLGTQALTLGTGTDIAATAMVVSGAAAVSGGTATITIAGDTAASRGGNAVLAGDSYQLTAASLGTSEDVEYVARDGDTLTDIAKALEARASFQAKSDGLDIEFSRSGATLTLTNNSTTAVTAVGAVTSAGTAGGGLELLDKVDVSTLDGAKASLAAFESLVQTSIDAAAQFGSTEGRIEIQSEFVSSLSDSLKSGIGALVDANMEETSARLQALQVQQQLAVQSLSIANQAPQSILSLFR
ncbi:MAG: flagellin [Yoonia sp.]|uniref:flagellin n=1 Tax=Rhodobacterales TaxID=204455 RepID=UPI001FF56A46|nr:flagellin [Loktanella sp. F6476L]MCK0120420.1 flagellin [Loktanella sp. F6476L]UWQ99215.1 flagellin [Rhodobacteraceae bacterium S2214]